MNSPMRITVEHAEPASADAQASTPRRVSAFDLVAATPWAIEPAMLDTIRAISRREGEGVEALQAREGRPLANAREVTVRDGVAIVPITGPIFRYANLFTQISGATSLDVLAKDFTAALDDPAIKGIVLEINSPGGQVTGIAEFAQMVHTSAKPVVAYVGGMAASAAYWIAAAASQIVMSKSGMAGNVGAVLSLDTRKDPSKAEIVSSQSPNKRPDVTTDQGRAQLQAMVDAQAQVFIEEVAAFRGMTPEAVVKDFNGGDMYIAAKAVAAGMADSVGTIEEVIAGLAGAKAVPPAHNPIIKGATMDLQQLRAAHPDLCAALVEEGRLAGFEAGATAERTRILDVEGQALPGHEKLIAQLKADGKTTGPMAAVAVLNAERAVAANRSEQLAADAPKPVAHAAAPDAAAEAAAAAAVDASLSVEERCKAAWDADPKVRAEYGSLQDYTAFTRAHAAGKVRILSK